jgi:hypothetical protein
MPRIARIIAPGYPHHSTQRGNNLATVFFDDEDRLTYLKLLAGCTQKHHVQIWIYCLMNNHIHLLAVAKVPSLPVSEHDDCLRAGLLMAYILDLESQSLRFKLGTVESLAALSR